MKVPRLSQWQTTIQPRANPDLSRKVACMSHMNVPLRNLRALIIDLPFTSCCIDRRIIILNVYWLVTIDQPCAWVLAFVKASGLLMIVFSWRRARNALARMACVGLIKTWPARRTATRTRTTSRSDASLGIVVYNCAPWETYRVTPGSSMGTRDS